MLTTEELLEEAHQALKLAEDARDEAQAEVARVQRGREMIQINEQILDVLRHDYQMLYRLAADRLAALDAAFPRKRPPSESQTGLSWHRYLGKVRSDDWAPEFSDPASVGHPV